MVMLPGAGQPGVVVSEPVPHLLGGGYALLFDDGGLGVEVVGDAGGGGAFAGGVSPLEDDGDAPRLADYPFLE